MLREGNVFTGVSHSVVGGVWVQHMHYGIGHMVGQPPPPQDTHPPPTWDLRYPPLLLTSGGHH